ncbi:MAG: cytochrome c oxidase subunit II [Hyphomicrobium sp.]
MSYLTSSGPKADSTLGLTWGLLIISIVVVVAMSALVLWAVFRSRAPGESSAPSMPSHEPSSFNIFGWGLATTILILVGCVAWTMVTLAAIDQPAKTPALTIEVTGNQWWWQVRYLSDEPAKTFVTANEIHVPVGEPVRVKLRSDDVIHSFWIPALAGKTDLIPGQVNTTWLEARKAGTYIGTCAEYCGLQHAHMGIRVVAEAADKFEAWRDNQLKAPAPATSDDLKVGAAAFSRRCAACHTVLGTTAGGILGPNLSHLMTRETLAAGEIPNDEGDLAGWIADPQQIKPGTQMPKIELTGDELQAITTYLISLK